MKKTARALLIITALTFALLGGLSVVRTPQEDYAADSLLDSFALSVPAFAQGVPASQFPGSEAGISAYIKVEQSVDLAKATVCFRGIHAEGTDYIIGIVELAGLPEELWPHLYMNTDGWFLAYFSKYDPASKLMPWNDYEGGLVTTTTQRDALAKFTTELFAATIQQALHGHAGVAISVFDEMYGLLYRGLILANSLDWIEAFVHPSL